MRRLLLITLVPLLVLTGCWTSDPAPKDPGMGREEYIGAVEGTEGVKKVRTSTEPWQIEVDDSQTDDKLEELGKRLHELTNQADLDPTPAVEIVCGRFHARIERRHDGGGPQPGPADLRWLHWLKDRPGMERVDLEHMHARVTVGKDVDPVAWARAVLDDDVVKNERSTIFASRRGRDGYASLIPGKPESAENFRHVVAAFEGSRARLTGVRADISVKVDAAVADHAEAVAAVDALAARDFRTPDLVDVRLTSDQGQSWYGTLPTLKEQLSGQDGLAPLVAATGSNLRSSSPDRNAFEIEAPTVEAVEKVVALVASPKWAPGPDSSVSIRLAEASNGSGLKAGSWSTVGPIWVDALRSGLVETTVHGPGGGRHERLFDIRFSPSKGSDLTTANGYRSIIDVLRRHDWEGDAQVSLAYGDHLIFWTTSKGKAKDAYNALHGAKQKEPYGWGKEFLDAWDASATK